MLRSLLRRVLNGLPSQCVVCRAWPAALICEDCVSRFAQPVRRCPTCALPLAAPRERCGPCIAAPPPLDTCHAAVTYEYPWADCLAGFKFRDNPAWASALATLLRSAPWVEPALEQADLVLPMPLSAQRLRERGFNQSHELARRLAPAKADASLLLRVRHTLPQSRLARAARLANVRGAFAVAPLRAARLHRARVLLVDDVMTSGASLHAAARTLREAGACGVSAVVLARTPP